jgi:TM2 domain-containing membrane protein YozV
MTKLTLLVLSVTSFVYAQSIDSNLSVLHQKENIIKFADHLFCEKDYLRSANEYLRIDEALRDEEINFKIALSLSAIGDYSTAKNVFGQIKESSDYYGWSKPEIMKIFFLEEEYSELRKHYSAHNNLSLLRSESPESKLYFVSYLKDNENIPSLQDFKKSFNFDEQEEVTFLYQMKANPPSKSPITASILSALIPGAGKIYTGEISDGIIALITTGLFSFLAYDNFQADHNFRAWLFTGLAAMFYAGNIYGSYSSAQLYNARIKFEFNLRLDSFLKSKNYFIPLYEFCE